MDYERCKYNFNNVVGWLVEVRDWINDESAMCSPGRMSWEFPVPQDVNPEPVTSTDTRPEIEEIPVIRILLDGGGNEPYVIRFPDGRVMSWQVFDNMVDKIQKNREHLATLVYAIGKEAIEK